MIKIMNAILKFTLASIVILMSSISASAQDYNEEKLFQQRAKERVKLMNDYVSFMADKSKSEKTRYYYRKKALPLFIGKGYEYEENGVTKQGVMMQTTSVNRPGVVTNRLLRDYFSHMVKLRYSIVKITSTEIADMKISDLKKVDSSDGKTLYMCTVQYVQYFRGEYADGYVYADKTTKRIVCYVEVEEVESDVYGKPKFEYMIMLGDVEVISTERS